VLGRNLLICIYNIKIKLETIMKPLFKFLIVPLLFSFYFIFANLSVFSTYDGLKIILETTLI
jgi:hypothetical protein